VKGARVEGVATADSEAGSARNLTALQDDSPTREPEGPGNPTFPQIEVFLTKPDVKECIGIRIHGRLHYLHSTTARMLEYRLHGALDVWNERLREAKAADPDNGDLAAVPEA
jgi:hypothetical protein